MCFFLLPEQLFKKGAQEDILVIIIMQVNTTVFYRLILKNHEPNIFMYLALMLKNNFKLITVIIVNNFQTANLKT